MANYCSLSDVKTYLSITDTASDSFLTSLIASASAYVDNWTNRQFGLNTTTYKANGNGSSILMVKNYPINAVTSLKIDGISYSESDGQTTGYIIDDFAIYLIGAVFTKGFMNVSIDMSYGYSVTPSDIQQVCIELVAYKFKETDRIGIQSKTLAGEVISFDIRDLKEHNRDILNNYNRVVPV